MVERDALAQDKARAESAAAGQADAAAKLAKEKEALAQRLAQAEAALAASSSAKDGARDLEARVRQLESEKAALAGRLAEIAAAKEEASRAVAAKAEAEEKLAMSLRSYSAITKERDDLAANLAAAQAKPALSTSPEIEARIRQLEADKSALTTRLAEAAATKDELAKAAAAKAEAEEKLAMSLRSYTALTKERDDLAAALAAKPAPAVATAAPTRPTPAVAASAPVAPAAASAARPTPEPAAAVTVRSHTIANGDPLTKISLRYYGTANRWPEILAANRDVLRTERDLVVGRVLRIP